MKLDCRSLEELFTLLAADDEFRARLVESPGETLATVSDPDGNLVGLIGPAAPAA